MIGAVKSFHLELTNKCTLKCPRCARTTFINKFGIDKWDNKDITLADLQQFLDIDLTGIELVLCGNTGDPIYHPQLIELVSWAKSKAAQITLITNGSYKSAGWWKELSALFDNTDEVIFSIDGVPDNFTKYRINADWASIEQGIRIVTTSKAKTTWKYIPFKYNVDTIEQAKALSRSVGIDNFEVTPSDRWEENDEYKPVNLELSGARDLSIMQWRSGNNIEIDPKCYDNKQHYISADGYYMPCCFAGDWRFYYKSEFYKNKEKYSISKTSISKLLANQNLIEFYKTIPTTKPNYCTFNCPKI